MKINFRNFILLITLLASPAFGQTTEFTYQGQLRTAGTPANGIYDFEFLLFDAVMGPPQVGSTLTVNGVTVNNGVFSVKLDFGANFPGAARFLEIHVRQQMGGAFTPLSPRQAVSSAPYAVKSLSADVAAFATSATNASNSAQLGGIAASQYITTTSGGANFIQNTTSPQSDSNFSISGTGTADEFNAATQYSIGGNRVLSIAGTNNLFSGVGAGQNNTGTENTFVGRNAGQANTTGLANAFFGLAAGRTNTTGFFNAFFGSSAGLANINGGENAFFGNQAGQFNTSGGGNSFFGRIAGFANQTGTVNSFFGFRAGLSNTLGIANTFLGASAGDTNTTGGQNTIIGSNADVATNNLDYATAIGADSVVSSSNTVVLGRGIDTVQVPGNLNITGTFTGNINGAGITNLNASNIASGTLNSARLGIVPIANGGTGSATQNFVDLTSAQTVGGDKTFSHTISGNVVNAATQFNLGTGRFLSIAGGSANTFVGLGAGQGNPLSSNNSFFGFNSGQTDTTGNSNSFFGDRTGQNNNGSNNSFFGHQSGFNNTIGGSNAFFGHFAGVNNTDASNNAFFGAYSGYVSVHGTENTLLGFGAGIYSTNGSNNTFVGSQSGASNTVESNNTFVGNKADGSAGITNATAIGNLAVVTQSNSLVLGSINNVNGATADTNVGIGTSAPAFKLTIFDSLNTGMRITTAGSGGTVASFGGNGAFQVDAPGVPGGRFNIAQSGEISFGTLGSAGSTALCRNASNQISSCSSSRRYKSNISSFNSGLSLINQLHPVSFTWKDGGMADMGLVAEDVAAVEPLLTTTNDKGEVEGVKYDRVGVVLINAVQEQQTQIEQQQKQIEEQRKQIENLMKIVCAMNSKADICQQNHPSEPRK